MPQFRKKPVVIEAVNLPVTTAPAWLADAMDAGIARLYRDGHADIDTLEGTHRANPGDWIIQGVKGELYPCKPDIFAMTYEPVDGSTIVLPDGSFIGPAPVTRGVVL
jgi:hypothetical protein